jgi:hypothetical protein
MLSANHDGKPWGSEGAGESIRHGHSDIIEFPVKGEWLGAYVTSKRTGTASPDSGARARVEQHMASGLYEREEVIAVIAYELLDLFRK